MLPGVIGFLLILTAIKDTHAASCANHRFGESDPKSKDNDLDTNTGFGYMMRDASYIVDCCGIVDRWEAYFDDVSGSRTVYFQVWRPTTGTTYQLVGQNSMTVSSDGEQDVSIAAADRITIKSGDMWGWWTSGQDIITYKSGGGEQDNNYLMSLGSQSVGSDVDWGSATEVDDRSYAIRMDTLPNDTPYFTSLPATESIQMAVATNTPVHTITADDINPYDVSSLTVAMVTTTSTFSFDSATLIVTTASSFTSSGTHTLVFRVVDQCSNTASGTLTVTVTNDPPVITSLPSSNSVSEDETTETLLHTIVVSDPEGATCSCSMASSVPSTYPFTVKLISGTTSYGIYSDSNPGFDYNTKSSYDITVDCTDGEYSDSGDFTAYLVKNSPPVFQNLQNSTSVTTASSIGTNAFTVLVSDPENDDLTFSMTCDPTPCPFSIFDSGEIQISEDLSSHTVVGYDLQITVSDGRNTVGPSILTITISDINDPVALNNLPVTKVVIENTAPGTIVYDVNYSDLDSSQTHSFSMTSSPSSGLSYFSISSSTGEVSVFTSPDYDVLSVTTFAFNVTVSDPVTSDSNTLTIEVTNVNEAPSFSQAGYSLSTTEGTAGAVIGTPSFAVTDPDTSDSHTLTLDCGADTKYFAMDSTSGEVTFQSNYDLDAGTLSTSVSCTVTATDTGGLTDTATLTIDINDINDNTPVFSPSAYTFHVSYYAAVGTVIGTVTATDGDSGGFGVLTYSLDQIALSAEYFSISNMGEISVKAALSPLGYATTVTITSTASDVGGLSDTATVVIAISDTTTTSTTTTTIRYKTFLEDSRNVTWLTICLIILVASAILIGYIVLTCHGDKGCKSFARNCRGTKKKKLIKQKYRRRYSDISIPEQIQTVSIRPVRQPPPAAKYQSWRSNV